jgi:hypothetical protein
MERAGEKVSQIIVRQKKHAFFQRQDIAKNVRREQCRKRKAEKG